MSERHSLSKTTPSVSKVMTGYMFEIFSYGFSAAVSPLLSALKLDLSPQNLRMHFRRWVSIAPD